MTANKEYEDEGTACVAPPPPTCRFDQRPIEMLLRQPPASGVGRKTLRKLHDLSPLLALLASVGSVWAAWEARSATLQSHISHRASLWSSLLSEWAQPEMLASSRLIRDWVNAHNENAEELFAAEHNRKKNPTEQAEFDGLDAARRRIASFYNKVYLLVENSLVDSDLVSQAFWSSYPLIRDVLGPLERGKGKALLQISALDPADSATSIARFAKLESFFRDRAEDGRRLYLGR